MWQPTEVGSILAEREYTFVRKDGAGWVVTVRVGQPIRDPEHADSWWCPAVTVGPDGTDFLAAAGVDPLQALLLALRNMRSRLEGLAEEAGATVTWSDQPGELGLPDDPGSRFVTRLAESARLLADVRAALRSTPPDAGALASLLVEIDQTLAGWKFPPRTS
jgi:hypothetical protein